MNRKITFYQYVLEKFKEKKIIKLLEGLALCN